MVSRYTEVHNSAGSVIIIIIIIIIIVIIIIIPACFFTPVLIEVCVT